MSNDARWVFENVHGGYVSDRPFDMVDEKAPVLVATYTLARHDTEGFMLFVRSGKTEADVDWSSVLAACERAEAGDFTNWHRVEAIPGYYTAVASIPMDAFLEGL